MIDLHCHLLPGIDDGPGSLAEAVAICRAAAADGCEALVATPHQGHSRWLNEDPLALRRLLARVRGEVGPHPRLHLGGEIRIGSELMKYLLDPRRGGYLPLADSRYLLLEFPRGGPIVRPEELVHELTLHDWRPIIAHPEFYPEFTDDLDLMARLVKAGAAFQVTAMSLTGEFGRRIRGNTVRLLDSGLVDFLASDAHGLDRRPPGLRGARQVIAARWGEEVGERLTVTNPRAVLENRPLSDDSRARNLTARVGG